jgi:sugar lactone lactonase YvrE
MLIPFSARFAAGALFALALGVPQASAQLNVSGEVPEPRTLQGHSYFDSIAFSPDGRTVASNVDKTVVLWDIASGQELRTLRGHEAKVAKVAFSPDGRTVAATSSEKTTKLWDTASGRELRTWQRSSTTGVDPVIFSPDGRMIATGAQYVVELWDSASGRALRKLHWPKTKSTIIPSVFSIAFSPDGERIVAGGDDGSGGDDGNVMVWNVASGRLLQTLRGHSDLVNSVVFSPDGQTIASASQDKTIKLWDAVSGRVLRTLQGHSGYVNSVAFSPDGRTVASGALDNTVKLWDAASGRLLRTLRQHSSYVNSVVFSPDGRTIASASSDETIKLWDVSAAIAPSVALSSANIEKRPPAAALSTAHEEGAAAAQIVPLALDRRVALVIGNSAYRNVQRLPNPANDANLIGAALRNTGIEDVTIAHDLDRDGMVAALKVFARKADAADWAMVYFAGHGIEVGGTNYLIPVDAKLETDRDVPEEAISLDQLQSKLAGAHKLKLIVLDACRNNPFASQMKMTVAHRSVSRGFTRFEPSGATLVVYAAKEGTIANDGDGVDSPFAISFAKRIVERGVEITMMLRFVRQDVLASTENQQEPFVYGSLPPENFYFVSPK